MKHLWQLECIRGPFSFSGTGDQGQMLWKKWGFGGIPPISILWDPSPSAYRRLRSLPCPFWRRAAEAFVETHPALTVVGICFLIRLGRRRTALVLRGTVEKRRGGHYASGGEGACAELELHLVVLNQTSLSQPPSAMIWGPWHKLCS